MATATDLTPRQLQAIIEVNEDCIKVLDLDARLLSMNDGGLRVMEIPDFKVCHHALLTSFWDGEDRVRLEAALDAARAGETRTFVGQARTFQGNLKWWSVTVGPLRDEAGQITHLLATSRDVTAQKAAEEAQRAAQARLEQHADLLAQQVRDQTRALEMQAAAQDAFVRFTETVGIETDLRLLAQQAVTVVQTHIRDLGVVHYELDLTAGLWRPVAWSPELSPELVEQIQAGVPVDTPDFAEVVRQGAPIFVSEWSAARNDLPSATVYRAAGLVPILVGGELRALFTVGHQTAAQWAARDQAIVRAVVRGLSLAMERAVHTQQLTQQRDDLDRRAQELATLLQLTEDQGETTDPLTLIRRAQELVLALLPPSFAAYYEAEGNRWRLRSQVGGAESVLLQAAMAAGFPVGATPSFDLVAHTREPSFVDVYDAGTDVDPEVAQGVSAHATLPLIVGGNVRGLFNVPLFESRSWTASDQAVLQTMMRHLGVVIERLERSAQLMQSNAELHASNQELEAFTYSVSHDLRTPVRHVSGYATLALKELARGDLTRLARRLDVVSDAGKRMETLLDAMLTLSRAGRTLLTVQSVPLEQVVEQVQRDLLLRYPDLPVTWFKDPLPIVQGDPGALQQVLRYLLDNALKFSPEQATVHVWVEERPQEWAVFVMDEGVGFDPRYAGRLFGAFQRLHTQQEFAGAGIGLATVKRLVSRHGGKVWAEGQAGQGATFGFSLPKTPRV
ncbi:PAS domain-containing sensor histidine kinase [Deinococcus radiotolerans]|uniref:histidine kinase n=1 Tax=Deinococcus radiotolerans TaxID=1309407 RepID=A0ABQ2FGT1_9DEIO|nr:ATP-binding protein [Deinococcus radiotolerans]GGK87926.1 hypothetical protein GCM10010844_03120 [Deinococcus radiotolerans]